MSFIVNTTKSLTGVNNLESAAEYLFDQKETKTLKVTAGDVQIYDIEGLSVWERMTGATQEVWTAAGKAGSWLFVAAGGITNAAQCLGLLEAPEAYTWRQASEATFNAAKDIASGMVNAVINNPRTSIAVAGGLSSLALAYSGIKDIANVGGEKYVTARVEGKRITVEKTQRSFNENIALLGSGVGKMAGAMALAYTTAQAVAFQFPTWGGTNEEQGICPATYPATNLSKAV